MAVSKAEILDAIAGMTVLDLSELIKEMEVKFGVSAAAAAVALAIGLGERRPPAVGVVRWMDAGKRNVLVLEDAAASDTTIIWVLDAPQPVGEGGGGSVGVA